MSLSVLFMLAAAPISFTVQQQGWDAASKTAYLHITAGDLDGDGVPDESVMKLVCGDGAIAGAYIQPRDSASGMPTGKRQHGVVTIIKEWDAASPQMRASRATYDIKELKGAKTMAVDDWTQVDVAGLPPVCAPAASAVVRSKSNITNN